MWWQQAAFILASVVALGGLLSWLLWREHVRDKREHDSRAKIWEEVSDLVRRVGDCEGDIKRITAEVNSLPDRDVLDDKLSKLEGRILAEIQGLRGLCITAIQTKNRP